jgi:hypothetical protein
MTSAGLTPASAAGPGAVAWRPDARARAWLVATALVTAGAIGAAIALAPPAGASPSRALAWLLFTGSSVHVASTGWFYTQREVRAHMREHRVRYLWVPLGLIAGAAALAFLLTPSTLEWPLLAYFAWQFFHYQKQNLGLAALAASASRAGPLSRGERRALLAAGIAGIGGLLGHPGLLQLAVRPALGVLFPVSAAGFAVAAGCGIAIFARRPVRPPAGLCVAYLGALLFSVPVFVFGSPYAAVAGMTVAHGLQYLLLMGLVAGGSPGGSLPSVGGCPRRPGERGIGWLLPVAVLANVALIGGALLSASSHLHGAAPAGRLVYGCYLGLVMSHFAVDAGLWRMRDPFPSSFLGARLPYLLPRARATP